LTDFESGNNGLPRDGIGGKLRDVIEANIPPIFRTNPTPGGLKFSPAQGDWTALHYANDLIAHHPKFKFIFKVKFEGFEEMGNSDFYYYVHRCDKPNITLNHTDVNYYNFRSRVLTSVTFQPIQMTLLDEIGNSVTDFFVKYMSATSGQAGGSYGVNNGFGSSSSSRPYKRGYSNGKAIIINQIFANGLYTNQYKFVNPRIESFQFDELNMEDNAGSLLTLQFSYDSLVAETFSLTDENNQAAIYLWGNTDILRGGGSSGLPNAGATSLGEVGKQAASSASGNSFIAGLGLKKYTDAALSVVNAGITQLNQLPAALSGIFKSPTSIEVPGRFTDLRNPVGSSETTIDRNVSETLKSIQQGSNFSSGTITGSGMLEGLSSLPVATDPWRIANVPALPTLDSTFYNSLNSVVDPNAPPLPLTQATPSLWERPLTPAEIELRKGVDFKGPVGWPWDKLTSRVGP
jgi:hypothetical protein